MQEAGRQQPVVLVLVMDERAVQGAVVVQRPETPAADATKRRSGRGLDQEGDDVQRDQDLVTLKRASDGRWIERAVRTGVRSRAHSGQRMPTGVGVMQSGQIQRPHDEHATAVSRRGWR